MNDTCKTIFFDMDGTICDLYAVPNWLPKLRNSDPTPYEKAAPLVNMRQLTRLCQRLQKEGHRIGIISWLSKGSTRDYDRQVRKAKREWLSRHFPIEFDEIHVVKYGYPKRKVGGRMGDILFDDEMQNVLTWEGKRASALRRGINVSENKEIIFETLYGLLP